MDVNTGEILSLISLPDYNLNTRKDIKDKSFTNKITKGVFELGSIFIKNTSSKKSLTSFPLFTFYINKILIIVKCADCS